MSHLVAKESSSDRGITVLVKRLFHTDSTKIAQEIATKLFSLLQTCSAKRFDKKKVEEETCFTWFFSLELNHRRYFGTIKQFYGGHSVVFYITLPSCFSTSDRNMIVRRWNE